MNRLTLFTLVLLVTNITLFAQKGNIHFGEKIDSKGMISYDDLLVKLKKEEEIETKVYGKVSGVCQVKGCWMTIVSDDAKSPSMFVKFKDYGFFMPLDLAGKKVVMKGKAYKEVTSVEELKHYAEDEGKSAAEIAKINAPKEELKFMASGVMILEK
jgi:hypothetical protein